MEQIFKYFVSINYNMEIAVILPTQSRPYKLR
jgi:hypothetical protein